MTTRSLSTVPELPIHEMGPLFVARRPPGDMNLDPFLNIDLFRITGPVFEPHPHAGFSAVTYLFDDSTTPMHNRDSLGDDGLIEPGGVHWTVAGSGIVHDEFVEQPGNVGVGAQIFVRLPEDAEESAPSSVRYDRADLPVVDLADGAQARVVAGSLAGATSPVNEPVGAHLYELWLEPDTTLDVPVARDHRAFGMMIDGALQITAGGSDRVLGPTGLIVIEPGDDTLELTSGTAGASVLFGAGRPVGTQLHRYGGFAFSNSDRVAAAVDRYQRGAMHGAFAN
jgi:redox-sensitive bicupin YhaK (pirin superfamily)